MNKWRFTAVPDIVADIAGDHPGRGLFLLRLYVQAHRIFWGPMRITRRDHPGLSKSQADRLIAKLVEHGYAVVETVTTGKRSEGTRLRLIDPVPLAKELALTESPPHDRPKTGPRRRSSGAARRGVESHDCPTTGPSTTIEPRTNYMNLVNGREPATLPPGLLGAAMQARMRLKLAGAADHGAWKGLAGEALDEALHATDQELATRCQRAGVTAAELDQAVTDYRGRWYPRAEELVDLVDAVRRRERARARHHEDELDLAGERAQIDLPDPAPDEPLVAPDLDAWARVLEGLRARIGSQDVEVWFRAIEPLALGSVLYLRVPNRYYSEWIENSYRDDLAAEVVAAYGRAVPVQWTWEPEAVLS